MDIVNKSGGKNFLSARDGNNLLEQKMSEQNSITEGEKLKAIPKTLMLELTNSCNHSCLFCYHKQSKRKPTIMKPEFAMRIIDEAYELGVRKLALYLLGEPFLYQYLTDIIKYAKQKKYEYVYLTTNGVLANSNRMKEVIDAGLDSIKFSIDAIDKDNYRAVHGVDDFATVYNNLVWLYDYKVINNLSIRVYVSSVLTKYNKDMEAICDIFKDKCDELVIVDLENPAGMIQNIVELLVNETQPLNMHRRELPCSMVFNRIHVTAEGLLTACCADFDNNLVYADLNEQDLVKAWNNDTISYLRNKHLCGDVHGTLCYNCVNDEKKREAYFPLQYLIKERNSI